MRIFSIAIFLVCSFVTTAFAQYEEYAPENEEALRLILAGEFKTALEILIPLSDMGDARAQSNLGVLYDHGNGVTRDIDHALRLFVLAAEQGFAPAQSNLGNLYNRGEGVRHDDVQAVILYRRAAAQGYGPAQNSLGIMYGRGDGVELSVVLSLMWFSIAAQGGNAGSQVNADKMADQMSVIEISESRKRAETCLASGFQNCL